MKNIVLIGFMGCGKTSIGKLLSGKTNREFIDTDERIQNDMQMSINDIFKNYGEEYFRKLETRLCREIGEGGRVIATGGGIVKNPANVELLKKNGIFVYLKAEPEKIYENIKNDETRPLLKGGDKLEKIKALLEERKAIYEKHADIIYCIGDKNVVKCADEITELIGDIQ